MLHKFCALLYLCVSASGQIHRCSTEIPLPSGDTGYLLSGFRCCDFGWWFCIYFGSSVAGSTEPVFSQDSFPHVVFPPCYQLPGVCGSTLIISYSSPADLVFLLCFPVVLQWLAILSCTYNLMMSRQVLLIITRKGELAHSLRWLIMVRKLVIVTITHMDNVPL